MPAIAITDKDDPRVADYRAIPDPELVRRRGLFVAEGRLVVRRLLEQRRFVPQSVLVTPAALRGIEDALRLRPDVPVYLAEPEVLVATGGFNFHRGCLALAENPGPLPLASVPLAAARSIILLEGLSQADNVGGVFRNAAAFGVDAVVLGPRCCDPLYRKALRTSMGAALTVPFATASDWLSDVRRLHDDGFRIVALTPRVDAEPIDRVEQGPRDRVALLVGAEGAGLTDEALGAADVRARIPMAPGVDSLNVATATGIALHRLWRPV